MAKILIVLVSQDIENIGETITESSAWEKLSQFLNLRIDFTKEISVSVLELLILITVIFITSIVLKVIYRILTRKVPEHDKGKFQVVFGYFKWLVYVIIFLVTLDSVGVNVTAIFAASAALLIGIGLALQTFFQDIISGVFILIDQSVQVGDIIELDGKVGRIEEIKLRTTRAVTIDNKVLIIPNHLYLTNILYNWTQNGSVTRENVEVGVAYGSDIRLVEKILINVANNHESILDDPKPLVLFTNFGDSSLNFKLVFTLNDSFISAIPKSDLRFAIDKAFKKNNISIPFPQRDIHIIDKNK
ncbi:mechanosensitive ion channel domain-containing protein [uncultured Winogradskyella sp.]|uniref:mechanosensitive ion channel family protein n=1 Tax=uncultured Winogradskyella sp. TaxID=395353 RepID=UPI0025EDCEBF|nr:mechanosensitive ion channel domain-containing protein [uncultured Winogradskyella sp.]